MRNANEILEASLLIEKTARIFFGRADNAYGTEHLTYYIEGLSLTHMMYVLDWVLDVSEGARFNQLLEELQSVERAGDE